MNPDGEEVEQATVIAGPGGIRRYSPTPVAVVSVSRGYRLPGFVPMKGFVQVSGGIHMPLVATAIASECYRPLDAIQNNRIAQVLSVCTYPSWRW